jgi:hypothetical protein
VRLPVPRALERIGGIQNQYAPSAYIRLWSCLDGFRRDDLTRALERRSVVQGTLMRATIHLVSAGDYWPLALGVRQARRDWWLRVRKHDDPRRLAAAATELRSILADGPRKQQELDGVLDRWGGAAFWIDLVRVPPSGTWERRRADLYGLAETWLGPAAATEDDGVELLLRRYLGAFGPAPLRDVASWAGLTVGAFEFVAERLPLRRFRDKEGRELLDLPRALLPPGDTPAPARLLPTWDATLLAHARRMGIVPEEYRPLLFHTKNPQSVPSFLVDGRVAGLWRHETGRIVLEPFAPLPRQARRELEDEACRLRALFA